MSNVLLFLIILLTTLSIIAAATYIWLKWKQQKQVRIISDVLFRNLADEITFYTSIEVMNGDLLEEERVIEGTWYRYFAYDSNGGFGCYMPMSTLSVEPDFSGILNNVKRSYLMGVTKNGVLESFTPTDLIYDWYYLRK